MLDQRRALERDRMCVRQGANYQQPNFGRLFLSAGESREALFAIIRAICPTPAVCERAKRAPLVCGASCLVGRPPAAPAQNHISLSAAPPRGKRTRECNFGPARTCCIFIETANAFLRPPLSPAAQHRVSERCLLAAPLVYITNCSFSYFTWRACRFARFCIVALFVDAAALTNTPYFLSTHFFLASVLYEFH